jgi:hypothetical protein
MNTENQLEVLKAQQARLVFLLLIPGTILFAFVMLSSSSAVAKLIAPLSVGTVMIILCALDTIIAIPLVIKLSQIKKQILKITEENPK